MDLSGWGELADANLAVSWVRFGTSSGGSVATFDCCSFVASGVPAAFFNGAFAAGPVADPDRVVAEAVAFMADCGVPWLLWVREGVDDDLLAAGRTGPR